MKLKWKYDKKLKQWWVYVRNDGSFTIEKLTPSGYQLYRSGRCNLSEQFNKLSSAKEVARLLTFG